MKSIVFETLTKSRLVVGDNAYEAMLRYRQIKRKDKEAGGILLGGIRKDESEITVDLVTTPQPHDKRARTKFYRSMDHHRIAHTEWESSDGYRNYLGLWHTHPESNPSPSLVDFKDWSRAVLEGKYPGDSLFFIILGNRDIGCWQSIESKRSRIKPVSFSKLQRI